MDKALVHLFFLFLFVGCAGSTPPEQTADESSAIDPAEVIDMHNSRISVDWPGTYRGVLPCADCQGIKTEIILFGDLTYEMVTQYLGRDEQVFRCRGSFAWDEEGGTIYLTDLDPMHETSHYRVGENRLFKLDSDGQRILGKEMAPMTRQSAEAQSTPVDIIEQTEVIKSKIIKDGRLGLQVAELEEAKVRVDSLVKIHGGYYANESFQDTDLESVYYIRIRIPGANFEKFIAEVEAGDGKIKILPIVRLTGTDFSRG